MWNVIAGLSVYTVTYTQQCVTFKYTFNQFPVDSPRQIVGKLKASVPSNPIRQKAHLNLKVDFSLSPLCYFSSLLLLFDFHSFSPNSNLSTSEMSLWWFKHMLLRVEGIQFVYQIMNQANEIADKERTKKDRVVVSSQRANQWSRGGQSECII